MTITTLSSREFNQDTSRAKKNPPQMDYRPGQTCPCPPHHRGIPAHHGQGPSKSWTSSPCRGSRRLSSIRPTRVNACGRPISRDVHTRYQRHFGAAQGRRRQCRRQRSRGCPAWTPGPFTSPLSPFWRLSLASFWSSGAIPSKGPGFEPGWIIASYRNLRIGPCPSMWLWRSGAHTCMFRTRVPSAARSSQQRRWCTA